MVFGIVTERFYSFDRKISKSYPQPSANSQKSILSYYLPFVIIDDNFTLNSVVCPYDLFAKLKVP